MEANMQTVLHNCCGLDVHKNMITACIIKTRNLLDNEHKSEQAEKQIREFKTFPNSLHQLKCWLEEEDCHHVAMESTGIYWCPVYEVLEKAFEGDIEIRVVNARHMRNVPGKKTDIKDAEWIAKLLRAGLLAGSFIPDEEIRELRRLTRYRKNIIHDITKQKNRIEKELQRVGFKLSSFLSDVFGVSGRNILKVLTEKGCLTTEDVEREAIHIAPKKRAEIASEINGYLSESTRDFIKMQLGHLDTLYVNLREIEISVAKTATLFREDIDRLDTIPGIATTAATAIIAEIGTDMSKFPTAEHLCSWAGLTPGDNVSAGKKKVLVSAMETHTSKV